MLPPASGDDPAPALPDPFAATNIESSWQATRTYSPATQLLQDPNEYLGASRRDIGRPVGDGVRELFVSCDPAPAMLQQFELLHPEFIAVHDLGTSSSRRLLGAVATASRRPMQKLVIRRQGYGTPLATLEFVEFDDAAGGAAPLRLYSTEADADTASRHGLARVLLAHSRLAVIMVGDLPAHALAQGLQPMQGDIAAGQWKNGHLLLLPLASPAALASLSSQLGRGGGRRDSTRGGSVTVRTTPQITSPAEAWNFISATWNRVREQLAVQGVALTGLPAANGAPPAVVAPLPPMEPPAPPAATPAATAAGGAGDFPPFSSVVPVSFAETSVDTLADAGDALHDYVLRLMQINGVVAACVFEAAQGRPLAHAGSNHRAADLAREGTALLAALAAAEQRLTPAGSTPGRGLRAGDARPAEAMPEAAVTLARLHLLVRPLPNRPRLALHAVLDKTRANLTLARLQIARLDATLGGDAAGGG